MTTHEVDLALKAISGGRVLDVATGRGQFVSVLIDGLKDYEEIIAVDHHGKGFDDIQNTFADKRVEFVDMDGARLAYPDASFDTVSISNSLHHLTDRPKVLQEMLRVLKPGGTLIISEMYRDGQTDEQMTHVQLHHWWAAVDTGMGLCHEETFTRAELVAMLEELGLSSLQLYDYSDLSGDPHKADRAQYLEEAIDTYQERASGLPDAAALQKRGETLRQRVRETGLHWATLLVAIGRK